MASKNKSPTTFRNLYNICSAKKPTTILFSKWEVKRKDWYFPDVSNTI